MELISSKKAQGMPISTLVIIILVVIVLVAVGIIFFSGMTSGRAGIESGTTAAETGTTEFQTEKTGSGVFKSCNTKTGSYNCGKLCQGTECWQGMTPVVKVPSCSVMGCKVYSTGPSGQTDSCISLSGSYYQKADCTKIPTENLCNLANCDWS